MEIQNARTIPSTSNQLRNVTIVRWESGNVTPQPWEINNRLVGCGLTSHSAIFQLNSDWTVVQFPNFDLLPGTQRNGQLGVFSVPSLS